MSAAVKTCLDCNAEISGRGTRCPEHHAIAEREARRQRNIKYRARKKAGQPPPANALVPAGGAASGLPQVAGFLASYDDVCTAVAELVNVPDVLAFTNKAAAVQELALRAGNYQLERDAAQARIVSARQLGFILNDMTEAGELRRHGHSASRGSDAEPLPPTLVELGVTKKQSMTAKALAGMDDFDDRMAQWSAEQEEKGGRVTLLKPVRAKERKKNDAYYSPRSMINEVCARWRPAGTVWEPCCGDGRFADALGAAGCEVMCGDIATGEDFFEVQEAPASALCTNPPFKVFDENGKAINEKNIRGFIDHAFAIGITEMCLIVPERLFACGDGRAQFERHKPAIFAQMDWREDYLGKGGQANMMLAVAIWTSPCAERCDYEIWSRENQPE